MDIYEMISEMGREDIADVLDAVLFQYKQLYPEWDISIMTTDKTADKNEQMDRVIELIQNMKEK